MFFTTPSINKTIKNDQQNESMYKDSLYRHAVLSGFCCCIIIGMGAGVAQASTPVTDYGTISRSQNSHMNQSLLAINMSSDNCRPWQDCADNEDTVQEEDDIISEEPTIKPETPDAVGFFVGNITTGGAVRSDFSQLWNQITPENEGKWGSVERSRDQYNWGPLDRVYEYARQHDLPVKGHTLVWGSQCPSWVGGSKCEGHNLSGPELAAEIEEWIRDYCTRYPDTQLLDVVNEATPGHAPAGYAQKAFGKNWIVKSFQLARKYCPNTTLILNDYNVLSWNTQEFIAMAKPVVDAGVVDAIGMQAHGLESRSSSELTSKLNQIAALGLPLYISEYDVAETDDQMQLQIYQQQFPLFYHHPAVEGITLWGYVYGRTWLEGSGLIREDGRQRPAMSWLMNYIENNPK